MQKMLVGLLAMGLSFTGLAEGVAVATWTGTAGDGDLANAANWSCVDASNTPVANGVPDADTKIVLTGALGVDFPTDMSLAFASVVVDGTAVLTRDCDRRVGETTPVVPWTTVPTNLDTLHFTAVSSRPAVQYQAIVKADGIYVRNNYTIIIIR